VSFPHLLVIFVIALVVLGPQKMPKLVAQVGRWAGKARAMARQFREQLESEINLEELNKAASKPFASTSTPPPPTTPPPDEFQSAPWPPPGPEVTPTGSAAEGLPADTAPPQPLTADDAVGEQHVGAGPAEAAAPAVAETTWTSDVHDHRLHAPAAPETQSTTPIIETHERGA